jgi:hypothetical protein
MTAEAGYCKRGVSTMNSKAQDDCRKVPASFGRRSFLFSAAGAGLAGATIATGLGRGDPVPEAQTQPDGSGQGYRLTGHIQRYYRSTRL